MKKKDVVLGAVYRARVSGKICRVQIDKEDPLGGWFATNLTSRRRIHIRTPRRLSFLHEDILKRLAERAESNVV